MRLLNERTGETIASSVELADTRASRRKGLLGRASLDPAAALVIKPCFAIHTAFMQFPIDVVFVDRQWTVRRIAEQVGPWRMAACFGARMVVELAAGAGRGIRVGDKVYLSDTSETSSSSASLRRTASNPACSGS
ncbi:MAG TPA: DUF192 domain-containing protein [Vicinamibacterales bacterium]|nr:DUF192 domain-containing protein [Vicinamibacterales bacterium]